MASIIEQTPYNEYTGNGVAPVYPYEFQLLDAGDLIVTIDGVEVPASDFTLSGVGVQSGGNVTFASAPANGAAVLLSRVVALARDTDYQYNGDLREETLDRDFNRVWQVLQWVVAKIGGAIRLPYPEREDELPAPADRANTLIGFNGAGERTLFAPTDGTAAALATALADPTSASNGPAMVAFNGALAYSSGADDTVGGLLYTCFGRTAREIAASVTPTNYAYAPGDIRRYGAVIGVDNTAAIEAADLVACSGTIILYGNTIQAEGFVYFPPGRWRATNLVYRGAPWRGAGINVSILDFYASSGACIDAAGTNSARKQLSISGMTLNGSNCTGTSAYALKLGYNQRSHEALRGVRIELFPGTGLYFSGPCWMMDWYSVYIYGCGTNTASRRTGIYIDPALGALELLAFNWYGLWLEDNGFAGSAVGGGMDISTNAVDSWNFHGGTWEGNYGIAEVRFKNGINIHVNGVYLEAFHTRVVNGMIFDGVFGSANNCRVTVSPGATGDGIKVIGASQLAIDKMYSNINWVNDISTANTSRVVLGESAALLFSVGAGSRLLRRDPARITLTHALTITCNAAQGTHFTVTIFDNDTMAAPTNPSIGQRITFTIIQSGVGAHTMSWNAVFKHAWSNTGNTANKRSSIEFEYDGTNWNQVSAQSPYA